MPSYHPDAPPPGFSTSPETVHEPVRVAVDFSPVGGAGRVKPIAFIRAGRKYVIKNLNLRYKRPHGKRFVWCFAVSDEANSYVLTYDPEELTWVLEEIYEQSIQS